MDHIHLVHCFKSMQQTRNQKLGDLFIKLASACDVIPKVAAQKQVHNQVNRAPVLKRKVHIDNKVRLNQLEKCQLLHYRSHRLLCDYASFRHFFHRVLLFVSF